MVEEELQALESLLEREQEILDRFPTLEPGEEYDRALQELSGSLQKFQELLIRLGESDLGRADSSTLGRLKELQGRRQRNTVMLQNILKANSEKMSALQAEKKAVNTYRPPGAKEPRFLDREG